MTIDPILDADLLRRLSDVCPGCGLHRVVDGRCTCCGSLKVASEFRTSVSEEPQRTSATMQPRPPSETGELRPHQAVTAGEAALISHIHPIQILAEPETSPAISTVCVRRGDAPPEITAPKTPRKRRGPAAEGKKQGSFW
jgi:hypothetical protein